jgi:aconitase A
MHELYWKQRRFGYFCSRGNELDIRDAAERYMPEGNNLIILSGKEYGSGSLRGWAAK